jgi:hypothetical protein
MAITFTTWKITGIKTANEGDNIDAVVNTYWEVKGVDENGNEGSFTGATPFTSVNVPAGEFVPFGQLTEEMVINWVKPVVTGAYEDHIKERIGRAIRDKTGARVEKQMPWAPVITDAASSDVAAAAAAAARATPAPV